MVYLLSLALVAPQSLDMKWLLGFALAILGFVIGGGAVGHYVVRAHKALQRDDLSEVFPRREELQALRDDVQEWKMRMQTEALVPLMELMRTTRDLASAVALQAKETDHLAGTVRDMGTDVKALLKRSAA